jgi:hypothetical protein
MDTITSIITFALLGLVASLVIGFIGLKFPAPLSWPIGEPTGAVQREPVPDGLPVAVRRWLSGGDHSIPAPASLVAWGRGSIVSHLPLIGRIWLPLSWTLYLKPGSSFIMENRVTWFRRRMIHGGEEYRDGKGVYSLGREILNKPFLDETERALAWLYFLWLSPGSLFSLPTVQVNEQNGAIFVTLAQPDKNVLIFNLEFSPDTGTLQTITTTRRGSGTGIEFPYVVTLSQPRPVGESGTFPSHFVGEWDHEVVIKLELVGLQLNQDISEAMQGGILDLK